MGFGRRHEARLRRGRTNSSAWGHDDPLVVQSQQTWVKLFPYRCRVSARHGIHSPGGLSQPRLAGRLQSARRPRPFLTKLQVSGSPTLEPNGRPYRTGVRPGSTRLVPDAVFPGAATFARPESLRGAKPSDTPTLEERPAEEIEDIVRVYDSRQFDSRMPRGLGFKVSGGEITAPEGRWE